MIRIRELSFNWRLMLMQILTNAVSLGLTALLLPGVRFQAERPLLALLASGLIFGLLNAFIRPILQFIMFRFLFITFGLVLIVINVILLWLLARITPGWFSSENLLWTILAAILVGLLGMFLETLLGMRPPIRDTVQADQPTKHLFSLGSAPVDVAALELPIPGPAASADVASPTTDKG